MSWCSVTNRWLASKWLTTVRVPHLLVWHALYMLFEIFPRIFQKGRWIKQFVASGRFFAWLKWFFIMLQQQNLCRISARHGTSLGKLIHVFLYIYSATDLRLENVRFSAHESLNQVPTKSRRTGLTVWNVAEQICRCHFDSSFSSNNCENYRVKNVNKREKNVNDHFLPWTTISPKTRVFWGNKPTIKLCCFVRMQFAAGWAADSFHSGHILFG